MELLDQTEIAGHQLSANYLTINDPTQASQEIFKEQMNVDDATMMQVLNTALSLGGDFADLYFEYTLRNSIILEEGIIKNSAKAVIMGVGIRVIKGEQTGYGYSENLHIKPMLHAARTAASIASGSTVKTLNGSKFNETIPPNYYKVLHTIADLEITEKIRLIQEVEKAAHAHDPRIIKVTATLADSIKFVQVASSDGTIMRDTRPMFRLSVQCIAQEKNNIQVGFSGVGGRVGINFLEQANHAKIIGDKAATQAILLLDAQQAPSGTMPVILGPAQSGILLHEAVGHPIEADFNRKGTSAYSGRIGEVVASELCTIYDSGQIENDRGALNVDDEGNIPIESILIEKGVLKGYMHDRISAEYFQTKASGNGRRESYAHYPVPRMTTTYLASGESDPEEIIRSVKKGVYCESFNGGQVDISNGDFVFVPTVAYMIEDGQKIYPIKNFTLIGNGPDAMSKVTMVGNDFAFSEGIWTCGKDGQSVPVGVGLPTVLVSELTVGGI
ncbi:MAG: metalloprotease TldD [SAR324 cluster bacterium]|nr:metalloprotease TldD [SAR324 cluster bacterium]